MGGKASAEEGISSFFINQAIILVFKGNLQSRVGQKESFYSANTKDPKGSAAVPKPKCFLFCGLLP